MANTVAILGSNGNAGSRILLHLLAAHKAAKVKLIVLHRPGNPPRNVPEGTGVQVRELDLSAGVDAIWPVVQGIKALVSAISGPDVGLQVHLVEALSQTPGFVTFVPARYSMPLEEEDQPYLPFMAPFDATEAKINDLAVGVTHIKTGMFDTLFGVGRWGFNAKENKLTASSNQLENWFPLTNLDHLGEAIANLMSGDLVSIVNKSFGVVTHQPSGSRILRAFSSVNGSQAILVDHSPADQEALMRQIETGGAFEGVYRKHWEKGEWGFPPLLPTMAEETLEQVVRRNISG